MKTPISQYQGRIRSGTLKPDKAQEKAVTVLQGLFERLMNRRHVPGWQIWKKPERLRGLYIYGGVGRGKSMLMDLFHECLPPSLASRRVHFHAFMIEVHDYLHQSRSAERQDADKALPLLAKKIAAESEVLCFDEFHVTDITDAMILGRLFTALFSHGVVVVSTSNWPPDDLYKGGLQRERFLPFIALMKERMEVLHLDSSVDYRTQCLRESGTYFTPLGEKTREKANTLFHKLTLGAPQITDEFKVKGRTMKVDTVAGSVARFSFAQLCERPLGAEDYLEIAERYNTVFLEAVPKLGYDRRNEAKRLMALIDALYEKKTRLVITAEAPPETLYRGSDHAFEFERTVSRLNEMQSEGYLSAHKT